MLVISDKKYFQLLVIKLAMIYYGNKINDFEVLNIRSIKIEYKRYVNNYYRKNLNLLNNGILRTKDIETLKQQLLSSDLDF